MTAVVVLNIVLSAFVVIGVLSLLAWGIAADRRDRAAGPAGQRRVATRAVYRRSPYSKSVGSIRLAPSETMPE